MAVRQREACCWCLRDLVQSVLQGQVSLVLRLGLLADGSDQFTFLGVLVCLEAMRVAPVAGRAARCVHLRREQIRTILNLNLCVDVRTYFQYAGSHQQILSIRVTCFWWLFLEFTRVAHVAWLVMDCVCIFEAPRVNNITTSQLAYTASFLHQGSSLHASLYMGGKRIGRTGPTSTSWRMG